MLDIGLSELLIILAVALIVLGPKKLPEIARSLGRGLAEFRRTSDDLRKSIFLEEEENLKESESEKTPPQPFPSRQTKDLPESEEETHDTGTGPTDSTARPMDAHASTEEDRDKE